MHKLLTVTGILLGLSVLGFCGKQAPDRRKKKGSRNLTGILADQNENVIVIRTDDGKEHLLWAAEEKERIAEKGDRVRVTFAGDPCRDAVLTLVSLEQL